MYLSPRQKTFVFLLLLVGVLSLIVLWIFVLNRGTLVVTGNAPYSIQPEKGNAQRCLTNTCIISLIPRTHTLQFEKKGYYDEKKQVVIKRWRKTQLDISFRFIPVLSQGEKRKLPKLPPGNYHHNIGDITMNLPKFSQTFLNALPQYEDVFLSYFGNYALLSTAKQKVLANAVSGEENRIFIQNFIAFFWGKNENELYFLEKKQQQSSQALVRFDRNALREDVMVFFPNPIANAILARADDADLITLVDKDKKDNKVYLIDAKKKTRTKIATLENITAVKMSPTSRYLLLESFNLYGTMLLHLYDTVTQELKLLDIRTDISKVVWLTDDSLLAATMQEFTSTGSGQQPPFIRLEEKIRDEFSDSSINASEIFVEYLPKTGMYRLFFQPDGDVHIRPNRLEVPLEGPFIRFESQGMFYELGNL